MRFTLLFLGVLGSSLAGCGSQQVAETPADAAPGGTDASVDSGSSGAGGGGTGGAGGSGHAGQAGSGGGSPEAGTPFDAGPPGGAVALAGVYNARETGGLPTSDGTFVRRNVLIRSGHLADLGAEGCQQLAQLGIRSVVDLRAASAASSQPDAECVLNTTAYYQADLPKILPPSEQSYTQTLDATEPKLAALFEHLGRPDAVPAVVHCVIGRDRASLVTAILLLSLGVSQDDVVQDFVSNQDASVSVEAAWLQPLLDRVAAAGGIESYLLSHGVTQAQIDQFRTMALQ